MLNRAVNLTALALQPDPRYSLCVDPLSSPDSAPKPHRRRTRYPGRNPRRFEQKYKEHDPQRFAHTVQKVLAAGKTPAGTHRPIMVEQILAALDPKPGHVAVDCTLGYGGHARELLKRVLPGGLLIGIDRDPLEIERTERALRSEGYTLEQLRVFPSNFAGLPGVLAGLEIHQADLFLADLGVSSMQLDNPARGFSHKFEGPLDMRMNPRHGQPASALLKNIPEPKLAHMLTENADEPFAARIAGRLAGRHIETTTALASEIRASLREVRSAEAEMSIRRTFQALRIAVNDEFSALESLLRQLPSLLKPAGRLAILTFHSGEDRRVKHALAAGLRAGMYASIANDVIRPGDGERRANPRSASAKLRWAIRAGAT